MARGDSNVAARATYREIATAVREFANRIDGSVVAPPDPGYDDARRVWNGMVNRYPVLVAFCEGVPDVRAAIGFARGHDLPVSVRGGAHDVAGKSVRDGALVVDCSRMDSVRVDPGRRVARVGPGADWGQLDRAAGEFGLATPGGVVSDTGVTGLTLGGGTGYLSSKHGLACDNLRAADVVTGRGEFLTAREGENEDLLWALRGGGGGVGVVTSLVFDLHPIDPDVWMFRRWLPADDAREAMGAYRGWAPDAPREACVSPYFSTVPEAEEFPREEWGNPALVLFGAYLGDPADADAALGPLTDVGEELADRSEETTYVELQSMMDADFPYGRRYYWKSVYVDGLPDESVRVLRSAAGNAPSPLSSIVIWPMHGAPMDVDVGATAFGYRDAPYVVNFEACWDDPIANGANVTWVREGLEAVRETAPGARGTYANFAGIEDADDEDTVGSNADRLRRVRDRYDPEGLFGR